MTHTIITPYAIQDLASWTVDKIDRTNIIAKTANKGAVTLKGNPDYQDKMLEWMWISLQIITSRLRTDTKDMPKGQAKLTDCVTAMSRSVLSTFMPIDNIDPYKQVNVGCFLISAFYNKGYLHIYRDEGYAEHAQCAPYILEATPKFSDLAILPEVMAKDVLRATTPYIIPDISQMVQGNGRNILKNPDQRHEDDLTLAIEAEATWLQAANKLQQQKWMINRPVWDVVSKEFHKLLVTVPPRPGIGSKQAVNDALKTLKKRDTKSNRDKFNHAVKLWNKELEHLIAASKNAEYEVIRTKVNELIKPPYTDGFYQYVELDYRGRVYYYEPLMNFQGSDMARGLMLFGNGKELTHDGLKWLSIHTACCYNQSYGLDDLPEWITGDYSALKEEGLEDISVDKMTLMDKELWTFHNMELIKSSTETLLDCEKPVSFLACCIEWTTWAENPKEHKSYLPIPIDGSCNGYQHSAAIAKDKITGELVSLVPQELQADMYVKAAQELHARMPKFFQARPDMKMKHIRKGIAKRAVMTRAYSAGVEKISDSMYRDCHQLDYTNMFDITMLDCMDMGEEIYKLIKDICPGATRTMEFLQDLAKYELGTFDYYDADGNKVSVSKKNRMEKLKKRLQKIKEPTQETLEKLNDTATWLDDLEVRHTAGNDSTWVEWVTPSGFHVIFEKYITKQLKVETSIPGFTGGQPRQPSRLKLALVEDTPYPDKQAIASGISPNVIHSLDASHMAGVISRWEGCFGAVHDSFSAHASDIDELSKLTRETFVEMYDVHDPYAALAEMILSPCVYEKELPELGDLDIQEVLESEYFFC